MSKFISTSNLSKLSKALDKRCIDLINEEKERAMGIEQGLQTSVSNKADINHNHDDRYFTETEMNTKIGEINEAINGHVADLNAAISGKADTGHNHDDRYFTETEVTTKLAGKADTDHAHDDMYYTETEIDGKITTLNNTIAGKADTGHNHDDRYYTETEINGKIEDINETITTNVSTLNTAIATAKSGAISESKSYTDTAIANLVDSAPEAMNTLNELAKAIGDHQTEYEAYVATVAANIATAKNEAIAEAGRKDTALHTTISAEIDADVKVEKERAMDAENALQAAIDAKADTGHNHDDRYYTETEIDGKIEDINEDINGKVAEITALLEYLDGAKANASDTLAIFIQSILSQEGESYDTHTLVKGEKIISPLVNTNTVIDDDGTTLTTYLSYFDTAITNLSSSIGNSDELLTDAKDSVVSCINELQTEINNLDNELDTKIEDINENINEQVAGLQADISTKAEQSYVDEKLEVVDALTLNGYSLWVGTTEELEAITERDPNTLYFEIDDGTGEEVVQVDIVDGVLQLTDDRYQKTSMLDGTTIVFPTVSRFTEIHLYFTAGSNMNINLPDNCKWRVEPNIEEGNSYEIIATYNTIEWLVNVIVYS